MPSIFFFEIQKLKIFEKKNKVFVSVSLRSLLFSNCQLAMFIRILLGFFFKVTIKIFVSVSKTFNVF